MLLHSFLFSYSGSSNWNDIKCSSAGDIVYAVVYGGFIFKSVDYGKEDTWVISVTDSTGIYLNC